MEFFNTAANIYKNILDKYISQRYTFYKYCSSIYRT